MSGPLPQPAIPQPSGRRLAAAFVAAPLAGLLALAVAMAALARDPQAGLAIAVFGLVFAAAVTLMLGVPLWFAIRHRGRATAGRCAAAGAVIGGAPLLLLILPSIGQVTGPDDLVGALAVPVGAVAAGALGGVVFWAIATQRGAA